MVPNDKEFGTQTLDSKLALLTDIQLLPYQAPGCIKKKLRLKISPAFHSFLDISKSETPTEILRLFSKTVGHFFGTVSTLRIPNAEFNLK